MSRLRAPGRFPRAALVALLAAASGLLGACYFPWLQEPEGTWRPGVRLEGLVLPAQVGPYSVADVVEGAGPDAAVTVTYRPDSLRAELPELRVTARPIGDSRAPRELARALNAAFERDRESAEIDGTVLLDERRFPLDVVVDTAYRAVLYARESGSWTRSLLYVYQSGTRLLEVRASVPVHPGHRPDDTIDDVARALFTVARPRRSVI